MKSDRLLAILLLLQGRGRITARRLAERLEVSERTILRDLDALSAAGVPVYSERGRHGGVELLPGYRTDVSGLTATEAQALFLFGGRGAPPGLGMDQQLRSALRKLMAALPEPQRLEAAQAENRVIVDPSGWRRQAEDVPHLATVQQSIWDERQVRLRYHSSGAAEAVERVVDPYGLVAKAGVWYLIAAVDGEPRLYRVSRIELAELVDAPSNRPRDLNLEALWDRLRNRFEERGPGLEVRLRVRTTRLDLLLRLVGPQLAAPPASLVRSRREWLELSLQFVAEGAAQAVLLGFAADVEVLTPETLRAAMARSGEDIARLYGTAAASREGDASRAPQRSGSREVAPST